MSDWRAALLQDGGRVLCCLTAWEYRGAGSRPPLCTMPHRPCIPGPCHPHAPRLIQGEGESEGCLTSCRMGPVVRALPHGPCIPRLCCVHALLLMPCPHALLIQMESEARTVVVGMVSHYVCIPVYFSAFSFTKHFIFTLLFILFIFTKKRRKADRNTANPCAATGFGRLLFRFPVTFL